MASPIPEPFAARPRALTVSELNHQARHLLESSFMQAWVEGELSSFSRPSSGHWYFSLKDQRCQVRCAMFKGFNQGLRQMPAEGDLVRIRGKVSLYENRGDFQIIVEHLEPAGLGALQQAFDALRQKLQAEGLFDATVKLPVPASPRHIGIITSATGAAIHDILTVLARRCPSIPVTLYPTPVQGAAATASIVAAIELAQRHNQADVLIVGRGGGSIEDLWCFNEEAVARAMAACTIPIVSAVGHEVDITIADLVADLRAPTPSAAAEKLSPDQLAWQRQFADLDLRLGRAARRALQRMNTAVEQLGARLRDPRRELWEKAQRLDDLERRLVGTTRQRMDSHQTRISHLSQRLLMQSPARRLGEHAGSLGQLAQRLRQAVYRDLDQRNRQLQYSAHTLNTVSPLATLDRGYAIVASDTQPVVRDATSLEIGDRIHARLARGSVSATVTDTSSNDT